jgi:hypothetical protein
VGEKKATNPGDFEPYDTTTAPAAALTGKLQTKIAGAPFTFDIGALNPARTALFTTFVGPVKVELLDSHDNSGALNATTGCRSTWTTVIQTLTNQTFNAVTDAAITGAAGRHRVTPNITEPNAWKDVRVRVSYPATGSATAIGCSTDNFAIRPNNLVIIQSDGFSFGVTDSNWQTAGTGRNLNNVAAIGGNVHKAGQPFTLSATAFNAAATPAITLNYAGSPDTTILTVCAGTACAASFGTVALGTWAVNPGPVANGKVVTNTATYSEAGAFNLTLQDRNFAAVDSADGTSADCTTSGYYVCSAAVSVGRFVPDHFEVTALITPTFKTFGAGCATSAFTYIGQPFRYLTAPQVTIRACNTTGACSTAATTTTNYSGTLWKLGGTSSFSKDCTTNPNICQFTTSWTGAGSSSSLVESYAYTLTPAGTPNWDSAAAATAAATVTPGAGTGTVAISASTALAFLRNTTTPQGKFNANISDTISVTDASEIAVTGNGSITTATPLVFNGAGTGIAFDLVNEFRYGRLRVENANGSQLISMPIPLQAQYWNGSNFVTNTADNCTTITPSNIAIGNPQGPGFTAALVSPPVVGGAFVVGIGSLRLSKPSSAVRGSVDVAVNLTNTTTSASCTAGMTSIAGANMAYLQGAWCGTTYVKDPTARATFGTNRNSDNFIYQQENY